VCKNITATFLRKLRKDSGRDQAPDYYIYEFTNIEDASGHKYGDKWIKENGLMRAISFTKGAIYSLLLSDDIDSSVVNIPYPIEISDGFEKVNIKDGNTIKRTNDKGEEHNLSNIIPRSGHQNLMKSTQNKFQRGKLTEELLLKWNSKGYYFYIKSASTTHTFGMESVPSGTAENYVLVQKETQAEINMNIESIKCLYLNLGIEKYFSLRTELIAKKKK